MSAQAPAARGLHFGVVIPFLLISVVWGSTWLVIKDQIGVVPPSWTIAYRMLISAAAMFVLAAVRPDRLRMDGPGHKLAFVMGVMQFTVNFHLVYRAEAYLTSGLVAVIFALLMVPNATIARLVLGQPIAPRFLLGSMIAVVGITLMIFHEYRIAPLGQSVGLGAAMVLGAILAVSTANVIQAGDTARRYGPVPLLAWAMLWGALFNVMIAFAVDGPPLFDPRPGYAMGVLHLAILGTVLTFPLYTQLIRDIGPGRAAYTSVLVPVIAMLLSTFFEGYRWSLLAAAGAALALAGLAIALSARRPSRKVG